LTIRALLYDANGADREVDLLGDGRPKLGEKQLLGSTSTIANRRRSGPSPIGLGRRPRPPPPGRSSGPFLRLPDRVA
jgi:hypothetical protein